MENWELTLYDHTLSFYHRKKIIEWNTYIRRGIHGFLPPCISRKKLADIKALADVPPHNSGHGKKKEKRKKKRKHTLKYHSWEVSSSTCLCQTRSPQLGIFK